MWQHEEEAQASPVWSCGAQYQAHRCTPHAVLAKVSMVSTQQPALKPSWLPLTHQYCTAGKNHHSRIAPAADMALLLSQLP